MRKIIQSLLLILFISSFIACAKKDPCEDITCINGGICETGTCKCPVGYEGTTCEKESLPKAIKVTAIKFLKIPAKKSDGSNWDTDNTNPDVQPALYTIKSDNKTLDAAIWTSNLVVFSARTDGTATMSTILPVFKITSFDKLLAMAIFDDDNGTREFMGATSFSVTASSIAGRPSVVKIDCATCTSAFELTVEYEF